MIDEDRVRQAITRAEALAGEVKDAAEALEQALKQKRNDEFTLERIEAAADVWDIATDRASSTVLIDMIKRIKLAQP